jgi:hypothetical protein
MRLFQSIGAGLLATMMVAFGMAMYLFGRGSGVGASALPRLVHAPELMVPLLLAFVLGFGLGWWNLRPE